jgi:hypothetical protein
MPPQIHFDLASKPIAIIGNLSNKMGEFSLIKIDVMSICLFPYITSQEGLCQGGICVLSVSSFHTISYRTLCHSAILPFCQSAIPPFRHSAIPPFRHSVIPPFRHSAIPPFHSNTQ